MDAKIFSITSILGAHLSNPLNPEIRPCAIECLEAAVGSILTPLHHSPAFRNSLPFAGHTTLMDLSFNGLLVLSLCASLKPEELPTRVAEIERLALILSTCRSAKPFAMTLK